MKNWFTIEDTLSNKISYYHVLLFAVSLPFNRFYGELILASLFVHTLIQLKRIDVRKIFTWKILTVQSVFFVTALGILYTTNTAQGFAMLGRQAAIAILPVILAVNSLDIVKYRKNILCAFALACAAAIAYLYLDAFQTILYYRLPISSILSAAFINHNFSEPLGIHATYLSMYALLSLIFLIQSYREISLPVWRLASLAAMMLLAAGLLQLGSRAVLLAGLIATVIILPMHFLKRRNRMLGFGISLAAVSVIVITPILLSSTLKDRYINDLGRDLGKKSDDYSNTTPRIERWKLAFEMIRSSPVTGYGSGDETDLLTEKYFEHKYYNAYLFRLNSHNEYISFLLRSGIIGLLVYLAALMSGFRKALRTKDLLFLSFMIIIATISCSENILDVNKGIFFYAFFFSLFLTTKARRRRPTKYAAPAGNHKDQIHVFTY
ncbi:MAG TPA: O-antigen ligase family protein [Chitinophagaceae bacterium]|nr:O-antigen ligase family protein [Chitinophagaceae bacterium]